MKKALVVFSGGQDSTTCLYWALKQFNNNVEAITFVYGQKHAIELECAKNICHMENVPHTVVDLSNVLPQLVTSALTSGGDVNELNEQGLPASFVPNRNQLFITLAHAYAQKIGAAALVLGVCETDYSGYPDCRQEYIDAIQQATNLGSGAKVLIFTPLMRINKAETFEFAANMDRLQDIVEHTHTCYNGDHVTRHEWGYGCAECPACKLREKGFIDFKNQSALSI